MPCQPERTYSRGEWWTMLDVNSVNKLQKRWSMCFGSVKLLRTFGLVAEVYCRRECDQVDFFQLMEDMRDILSMVELELFWVQCWLIWNQRNTVEHGGMIQHPSGLTKRATDYIDEFKDSQVHLAIPVSVGAVQRWSTPSGSVYKVNFDASVLQALIPLAGPSVSTSEEAEVLACRKALELAVDAGFRDVVVEGDNSAVMKAILSSPRARWSRLGHLYEDISCLSVGFRCIKFECVRRSANNVAHMLARFAKSVFFFFFFFC